MITSPAVKPHLQMNVLILILVAVALEVAGQSLYKAGLNQVPATASGLWTLAGLMGFFWNTITRWRVLLGLVVYILEVLVWWVVLSKADVSYAFPLTSMSYVLLLVVAHFTLHEHIPPVRWLGAGAIMGGVYLITRSLPHTS